MATRTKILVVFREEMGSERASKESRIEYSNAQKYSKNFIKKMNRLNTTDFVDALFLHTSYFVVVACEVCSILNSNDSHIVDLSNFFVHSSSSSQILCIMLLVFPFLRHSTHIFIH